MFRDAMGWTSFVLLTIGSTLPAADAAGQRDEVDFNRDVRPIFSNHCYACHGPDSQQRQGEFRLDIELDAYSDRGGYRPIVRNDPAQSELYRRIASSDTDEIMPPADFGKKLSNSSATRSTTLC